MGVSLERVQFKFASIIGELCSEPIVLSQFAVWLDLRLAEYKSKGAISLDCSGEKPDPSWLKGLRTAAAPVGKKVLGSRLAPRSGVGLSRGGMYSRSSAFHRRNVNSHSRMTHGGQAHARPQTMTNVQSDVNERLSGAEEISGVPHLAKNADDIVVIKDEPSESNHGGVFPVSLHSHQALEPDSRKRPARDSVSSDTQDSSTPFKVRKSPSEESPLNQSLISVLGSAFEDQNPEMPSGTNDSAPVSDMDYSANLQDQSDQWADNSTNFHSSGQPTTSTSTFSLNRPSASATITSNSSLAEGSISMDTTLDQSESNVTVDSGLNQSDADYVGHRRAPRLSSLPRLVLNRRFSANSGHGTLMFERWLMKHCPQEQRHCHELEPHELDGYMATFFRTVRKPGGGDYNAESFRNIRSRLIRMLKDRGYPHSITSSRLFTNSQQAFKQRLNPTKCVWYLRGRGSESLASQFLLASSPEKVCQESADGRGFPQDFARFPPTMMLASVLDKHLRQQIGWQLCECSIALYCGMKYVSVHFQWGTFSARVQESSSQVSLRLNRHCAEKDWIDATTGLVCTAPSLSRHSLEPKVASQRRRQRVVSALDSKGYQFSESTIRHVVSSVSTLEQWLWESDLDDHRNIEDIPPERLDFYLQLFYDTVKKPDGQEYTGSSLKMMRSKIDVFLKNLDYPCSIVSSPEFRSSQMVYRQTRARLDSSQKS